MKEFDKKSVSKFRDDFQDTVTKLEKKYGVHISLGNIRFDGNHLRGKVTATKGTPEVKSTKEDFAIGDRVKINHKKISPHRIFAIRKINKRTVSVRDAIGSFRVSPSLLGLITAAKYV